MKKQKKYEDTPELEPKLWVFDMMRWMPVQAVSGLFSPPLMNAISSGILDRGSLNATIDVLYHVHSYAIKRLNFPNKKAISNDIWYIGKQLSKGREIEISKVQTSHAKIYAWCLNQDWFVGVKKSKVSLDTRRAKFLKWLKTANLKSHVKDTAKRADGYAAALNVLAGEFEMKAIFTMLDNNLYHLSPKRKSLTEKSESELVVELDSVEDLEDLNVESQTV